MALGGIMATKEKLFTWIVQGHKIFRVILLVQWLAAVVIGIVTGQLLVPLILGSAIIAVPLILSITQPASSISRHAISIGVQLMTALHIHQSFGLVEVHFEIFALIAILAVFRDWKVILTSVLVVAVHHVLFYLLQANNSGVFIFDPDHISFGILVLHAFFAVAEGAVVMMMCRQSFNDGIGTLELSAAISKVVSDPEQLDLTIEIDTSHELLRPLALMVSKLKELIRLSNLTAIEVNNASSQILIATQELSRSITERTEEIRDISNASQQISQKIKETTSLTDEASSTSSDTSQRSQNTFDSVNDTNNQISSLRGTLQSAAENSRELSQWSASIANAMNSITSISDQTNLLALNAAIESARAGEHGRGFAVVAEEVRNLAIKSKQSAEEISEITSKLVENTGATLENMESCVELVDKAVAASSNAAENMRSIIGAISSVATNISTVSEAALEQDRTSHTIATRTEDVQKGAEHEVVISQELEAQVSSLNALSEQMKQAALRFKIE